MGDRRRLFIVLFFAFVIFPFYAHAAQAALSDEAKVCLTCHASRGLVKTLENKEILPLYVDKVEFASSAHNETGCGGCHTGYMAAHVKEKKVIKRRREYTAEASRICSMCHPDDLLKKIPIHSQLMTKALCVECHAGHYIEKISEWKKDINEIQSCLAASSARTLS